MVSSLLPIVLFLPLFLRRTKAARAKRQDSMHLNTLFNLSASSNVRGKSHALLGAIAAWDRTVFP